MIFVFIYCPFLDVIVLVSRQLSPRYRVNFRNQQIDLDKLSH